MILHDSEALFEGFVYQTYRELTYMNTAFCNIAILKADEQIFLLNIISIFWGIDFFQCNYSFSFPDILSLGYYDLSQ